MPNPIDLNTLQRKWLDLSIGLPVRTGAAPFLCYAPRGYSGRQSRILYVGKATRGDFHMESFIRFKNRTISQRLEERRKVAQDIFNRSVRHPSASFWGFAQQLSLALEPHAQAMQNLAWSNLCKIGVVAGNPGIRQIREQQELATHTLAAEIEHLRPTVIIGVTGSYAEVILKGAVQATDNSEWIKSEETSIGINDVWWLPKRKSLPPVLWMRHPQGSKPRLRKFAIDKVRELSGTQAAAGKPDWLIA